MTKKKKAQAKVLTTGIVFVCLKLLEIGAVCLGLFLLNVLGKYFCSNSLLVNFISISENYCENTGFWMNVFNGGTLFSALIVFLAVMIIVIFIIYNFISANWKLAKSITKQ